MSQCTCSVDRITDGQTPMKTLFAGGNEANVRRCDRNLDFLNNFHCVVMPFFTCFVTHCNSSYRYKDIH